MRQFNRKIRACGFCAPSTVLKALSVMLLMGGGPSLAAPPQMPEKFDKPVVQGLIDKITDGQNAVVLAMGYFMRRTNHPFPAEEGMSLLKVAVDKEPAGSQRWFQLQSVRGFGGFHVGPGTIPAAYEAYESLFGRADEAAKADASAILSRSIYEFVVTMKAGAQERNGDPDVRRRVVLKAFEAYLKHYKGQPSLTWDDVLRRSGGAADAKVLADKLLAEQKGPATFALLSSVASVYKQADTKRHVELLLQAKALLPKDDPEQVRKFYATLADAFVMENQIEAAIEAQLELVKLTGSGRAGLMKLHLLKKDEKAVAEIVVALGRPDADEQDVNDAARLLYAPRDEGKNWDQAVTLLTAYLAGARQRDVAQELSARMVLGAMHLERNQRAEAKAALNVEKLQPPVSNRVAQAHYRAIQSLIKKLERQ